MNECVFMTRRFVLLVCPLMHAHFCIWIISCARVSHACAGVCSVCLRMCSTFVARTCKTCLIMHSSLSLVPVGQARRGACEIIIFRLMSCMFAFLHCALALILVTMRPQAEIVALHNLVCAKMQEDDVRTRPFILYLFFAYNNLYFLIFL